MGALAGFRRHGIGVSEGIFAADRDPEGAVSVVEIDVDGVDRLPALVEQVEEGVGI